MCTVVVPGIIGSIPVYSDLELCLGSQGAYLYTGFGVMPGVMGSIPVYSDVEFFLGP